MKRGSVYKILLVFAVLTLAISPVAHAITSISSTPYTDTAHLEGDSDQSDWEDWKVYKIYLNTSMTIHIVLHVPSSCDFDLLLLDSYDPYEDISEDSPNVVAKSVTWEEGGTERIDYTPKKTQYYYIMVLAAKGSGTYTLDVSISVKTSGSTGPSTGSLIAAGAIIAVIVILAFIFLSKGGLTQKKEILGT